MRIANQHAPACNAESGFGMAQQQPPPGASVPPLPATRVRLRPVSPPRDEGQRPLRQLALISRDPELATALQAEYGHLVEARRFGDSSDLTGPAWQAVERVIVDVRSGERRAAYEAVRRHYRDWLIMIVNADEEAPPLPEDPRCVIIGRPFTTVDLLELIVGLPRPQHPGSGGPAVNKLLSPARPAHRRTVGAGRRLATAAAIGLLAFLIWFGVGLFQATQDVRSSAEAAHHRLGSVDSALNSGRPDEAQSHIGAAKADLDRAEGVLRRRQVRIASRLPLLAGPVRDLGYFLDAARHTSRAADSAVLMFERLSSRERPLLRDRRFDLASLSRVTDAANRLAAELAGARADLLRVRGGVLQPGVEDARASGLRELDNLEGRVQRTVMLLRNAPSLLGVGQARLYLVVMTNPAELRSTGGVPSAAVSILADSGVISVRDAARVAAGGTTVDEFAKASSTLHFPISGEALLRAYEAMSGVRAGGVISVDPPAMRAFLRATGPVSVPGYGRVTANNVERLTMRDAYRRWPAERVRARYNQGLFNTLLRRLLDGQQVMTKARALGTEGSGRHLQAYLRDTTVQPLIEASVFGGTLGPGPHDYLAVYTQSTTGGGTAAYDQRNTIRQRVQLRPEGSAEITRTIKLSNPPGGSTGTLNVATYLPQGASLLSVRVNGRPQRPIQGFEAGRPAIRVGVTLPKGRSVTVDLRYKARQAATRTADGRLRYELVADIQPMVQAPSLEVAVQAPPGMLIESSPGWSNGAESATLTTQLVKGFRRHILVRPDW